MDKIPQFPNKLLVLGTGSVILGGIFLFWTLGQLPSLGSLWPIPFMIAGLFFLYFVFLRGKKEHYILPGMILMLGGLFFLLWNTVIPEKSIKRIWPAFMLIAGLSLIPYAFKKKSTARTALIIPAVFIILLALLFFPFSLGKMMISFRDFALRWWPVLIIIIGICLIVSFLFGKTPKKKI